ncbi:hypothetical protein BDZ97DRAFT_1921202 [Flammula alnicola]|nr:hypothetical protein BDZ97DRAFT_1921202 [Flammula alnicola]
MSSGKKSAPKASAREQCALCLRKFDAKGIGRHRQACKQTHDLNLQEEEFLRRAKRSKAPPPMLMSSRRSAAKPWETFGRLEPDPQDDMKAAASSSRDPVDADEDPNTTGSLDGHESGPFMDDIKIEYHPHTKQPSDVLPLKEYQARQHKTKTVDPGLRPKRPWKPFRIRAEFEFAEVALKASLTKNQVNALISVMKRCTEGDDKFDIRDHAHLCEIWNAGAVLHTAPEKHLISVKYKEDDTRDFDFWSRSIWDWALERVQDPFLAQHFQWDAQRLSKFDGAEYERFIHEPYTADRFWDIQVVWPSRWWKTIVLYSLCDKTKLSSFGTAMGYPVYARIGNIDVGIRNGDGVGGGELVGWLPIVPEDEAEKGKKSYVDFKRVVWHQSFFKLLETIAQYSKTGCWVKCGDGIERQLFPVVLILSADYEEQCIMGLNRGYMGLQPCPICHIPKDQLHDCGKSWPLRTGLETQKIIAESRACNASEGEELLKANGLRAIDNAFMSVEWSDPHKSLSYDPMHNDGHGLGGKHLYPSVLIYLKATGRGALAELDKRFRAMPSWSGLTHFNQVASLDFTDASKLEDLVKILLFTSHNLIGDKYTEGPVLLSGLRAYLNLCMYTGFKVHTTSTIASGREEVKRFSELMKKYKKKSTLQADKSWDIPKMHLRDHTFDDILAKGVTRNYNTKINEGLHGPIKDIYEQIGNGKDVDEQIMHIDHRWRISKLIRFQIDLYDGKFNEDPEVDIEDSRPDTMKPGSSFKCRHIIFGAVQKRCSFKDISAAHADDPAFTRFLIKFSHFLRGNFSSEFSNADLGRILDSNATVLEYRYLKVSFTSKVTWQPETNHLRCNPRFNNKPRYDYILVTTPNGVMFAQLLFMFTTATEDRIDPWVLIQPFDAHVGQPTTHEKGCQLYRIRAKARASSCFVSAKSIIRGVVITPTYIKDRDSDYYVFDLLDEDLFLRVRDLWKERLGEDWQW